MPGIKEVFAAAAQLVRMRLAERVEVAIEGSDKVKVEIGRADAMMFTIGKDGAIYGPDTTTSAGNINDDSIRDVIANSLILEFAKRQDARGG
jgi:hypothetical protein